MHPPADFCAFLVAWPDTGAGPTTIWYQFLFSAWRAPIGWSGLIVSASWASGPSERCFPVPVDDSPMRCAA